jgi:hypothetical protein
MTKRRKLLVWAAAGVALLVLGAGIYGSLSWQQFKREQGIVSLDIHGVGLSAGHFEVREIVLIRQPSADERQAITVRSLRLDFADRWQMLPLRSLAIDHVDAHWQPAPAEPDIETDQQVNLPDRQQLERWAGWLPREGQIQSFFVTMPCRLTRCTEKGQLSWQLAAIQPLSATVDVQLEHQTHRLAITVNAYEQGVATHMDLGLLLDGQPRISMQNQFAPDVNSTLWRGTLAMSELPEAPWLLEWLGKWLPYEPQTLPDLPEQMRIGAGWATHIDTSDLTQTWDALDGDFRLSANLPAPWPVVGIGQVQGQLDIAAKADQGFWLPTELSADLQLLPEKALAAELPAQLRPDAISLKITPRSAGLSDATMLALQVQLATAGPTTIALDGPVLLNTAAPYSMLFEQTRLRVRSPSLKEQEIVLKGLDADLRLSGQVSQKTANIRFDKGSKAALSSLASGSDLSASNLLVELAGIGIDAAFADGKLHSLAAKGKTAIAVGELKQSALRPQGWRWNGTLAADQSQLSLDGPLSNDAGLTLPLTLKHNLANRSTRLNATLPEVFLRAGNPVAATLADWPQALELSNGRLQGKAQLDLPASGPLGATATVSAKGLGGIYDRTELSGLDAELSATLQRNLLRLDITELTLREANPGFTFGPLRFNGEFSGPLDDLAKGRLAWSLAEVRLLGGRLWLEPGAADLAAETQQLQAHLRGLQLPLLLEAYPADGLTGTGVIDGNMLVQRAVAGISIEQGSLKAREPGGALQFRSAKIQALGQSNQAMRLVTEALDDFHYDLLSSDLHYGADGKLDLGLKLHGRNPALEGGRPINFSINLEEDIPALLTSLQLSDRVSETIQRRVQERLR